MPALTVNFGRLRREIAVSLSLGGENKGASRMALTRRSLLEQIGAMGGVGRNLPGDGSAGARCADAGGSGEFLSANM